MKLLLITALLLSQYLQAQIYVDQSAVGTNDGSSWVDAFTSIQEAVDAATAGDIILMAQGTYNITSQIEITDPLTIKGGYPTGGGAQEIENYPTIIDAYEFANVNKQRVINATHSTGVIQMEGLALQNGDTFNSEFGGGCIATVGDLHLNSMTIKNCIARIGDDNKGGGIYSLVGHITLINSIVSNNRTNEGGSGGGGIYSESGSILLIDSQVSNNDVSTSNTTFGGGLYTESGNIILTNSHVSNNYVSSSDTSFGGGVYTSTGNILLINSHVSDNEVSSPGVSFGGGIFTNSGNITLNNSKLSNNSLNSNYSFGGGVYLFSGIITLTNSLVYNNTVSAISYAYGGGVYTKSGGVRLTNSLISNNTTSSVDFNSSEGGGIFINNGSDTKNNILIQNSILWNNSKSSGGGSVSTLSEYEFANPIDLMINYSLIKNQNPIGVANIDAANMVFNPLFINEANGDFGLQAESPLIDAGDFNLLPLDDYDIDGDGDFMELLPLDLDGYARDVGFNVDIGPYEFGDLIFRGGFE